MKEFGQNFPVSDYYKGHVLDAQTVARGGGWWTAVLLIRDPKTSVPFVAIYRWQADGETWKKRKSIAFKSKKQLDLLMGALGRLSLKFADGEEV